MILRKLKRLLGLGAGEDGGRSERDVTMQDRSDADAENESSVKGVDEPTSDEDDEHDDPVATGTDADASTESLVDEELAEEEPSGRAEPAEAAGQESDEDGTEAEVESPDVDTADEETAVDDEAGADETAAVDEAEETGAADETGAAEAADASEAAADSPAVDEVKGIGPAYSERLAEIGIETVADLADADAEEVANRTTAPEKTVQKWIDRASEQE